MKRWDVQLNWAMIFARTLHWFNPLAWTALRRVAADQELLCDARIMQLFKIAERPGSRLIF